MRFITFNMLFCTGFRHVHYEELQDGVGVPAVKAGGPADEEKAVEDGESASEAEGEPPGLSRGDDRVALPLASPPRRCHQGGGDGR